MNLCRRTLSLPQGVLLVFIHNDTCLLYLEPSLSWQVRKRHGLPVTCCPTKEKGQDTGWEDEEPAICICVCQQFSTGMREAAGLVDDFGSITTLEVGLQRCIAAHAHAQTVFSQAV